MPDEKYMRRALVLAKRAWGQTSPNPIVGAVVVREGRIVGEGFHARAGSAHAEVNALAAAGTLAVGAELYVTLEPCSTYGRTPPCTEAILKAGIKRVWIGCLDPNPKHAGRAVSILESQGVPCVTGLLEKACRRLNESFFHWVQTGRPWVILKLAQTLDGKIATATGDSQWVTSERARRRVQALRRLADAVLIGGGTARKDTPSLRVRVPANWKQQPRRLVASKTLPAEELSLLMPGEPRVEKVDCSTREQTFSLLERLGSEGVMTLLCEGGGELAASLLAQGAVNRVEFHVAPKILGGNNAKNAVGGASPRYLSGALNLQETEVFSLTPDVGITGILYESACPLDT